MSRITISDLAIDSNSFINEVAETEAAFVNGGSLDTFNAGFGKFVTTLAFILLKAYKIGLKAEIVSQFLNLG
ncbi:MULTISPECIES: hypothetical protein [unclassified Tolypothrix]|uniref:hypothetical protein n=1 Tax=unclassified Tolypothrix TaxID=2649714 RepID=UPI0005EAA49F|nr:MULTISPECIES: hypothetical protein [unclassified Tolypothrix]BAY93834.1 hypothetical protein NIES3275_58780 [Microchaete diplosiphon NIES-3275]EKF03462.1 hypothetical protein FDUTEX481_02588 [Tolypothrix sp. PCC 7601]MBE9081953.1 hypothetical protein [Tolypothrix sp. LEGE 11397]UYD27619.1 hypothetical protein HGR01_06010 [Tolypothrix sp. PCC 7712]UYD36518.1 hypothetical protein HG267_12685 [Tolypothrix sp. PCC 7601]